jgi:hypothetical protein
LSSTAEIAEVSDQACTIDSPDSISTSMGINNP